MKEEAAEIDVLASLKEMCMTLIIFFHCVRKRKCVCHAQCV